MNPLSWQDLDVTSVQMGILVTQWAARMPQCPVKSVTATVTLTLTPWQTVILPLENVSGVFTTLEELSVTNVYLVSNIIL